MAELTITPKAAPTATTKPSKKRGKADAIEITFPKYDEVKPYNKCGFDLTDKDKTTLERSKGKDGSYILTIEHPSVSQMQGAIIDQMTEYCAFDGKTGAFIGGQIDSNKRAGEKEIISYYTFEQNDRCNLKDEPEKNDGIVPKNESEQNEEAEKKKEAQKKEEAERKAKCDPANRDNYLGGSINLKPSFKDGKFVRVIRPKEEDEAKVQNEAQ